MSFLSAEIDDEEEYAQESDKTRRFFNQGMHFSNTEGEITEIGSSVTWKKKMGGVDVSVGVENVDQNSQWKNEWDKKNNHEEIIPKRKEHEDEKENPSPSAHVSIHWGS